MGFTVFCKDRRSFRSMLPSVRPMSQWRKLSVGRRREGVTAVVKVVGAIIKMGGKKEAAQRAIQSVRRSAVPTYACVSCLKENKNARASAHKLSLMQKWYFILSPAAAAGAAADAPLWLFCPPSSFFFFFFLFWLLQTTTTTKYSVKRRNYF